MKTESIRRTTGEASTDKPRSETAATDRQTIQQPPATRRTNRVQRVAAGHRPRAVHERAVRTRRPAVISQATQRVSSADLPVRARSTYAQATYVDRRAAVPADRIVLTEPQVTRLNAAFADYIVRMNVWTRPPWEFTATVGAAVPEWVQVYGVPAEIVAIYPEFSGDAFVVVGDDIVVLEPGSRRIVAMLSRTANAAVAVVDEPPATTGLAPLPEVRVRLTRAQIAVIRTVARDRACRYERPSDFFIGSLVPATAPLCAFPERVIAAVPDIADYRYITRRNEIVVIDPGNDRVVTVIR